MKLINEQIKIAMRNKNKELVLNLKTLKGEIQRNLFNLNEDIGEEQERDLINRTTNSMIKSINKTFKNAEKKGITLSFEDRDRMNKEIETWHYIQQLLLY